MSETALALPVAAPARRGWRVGEWGWAIGLPVGFTLVLLALWQAAADLSGIPTVLLPSPLAVLRRAAEVWPELLDNARYTGLEAVLSFLIASLLGVAVAAALSASERLREALYPNLVLFQLIPKIALAPLFVLWLGIGSASRLTFAVFVSFFPVAIATLAGLASADGNALRLCRSLNARGWQTFLAVRVPYSLPFLFSGLKVAATMAFIGVVVGEFISARAGLGYYILFASSRADTPGILAAIGMLCLLGLALYGLIALGEQAARRWWRGG
ncbi:ABC transporter permease [Roseomonas sp. NAR14]|uniref:ABC transporter permease n=1 Tax=Roseomonas acroporae TaxID=2937791 RepID=A0A9X2BXF3_9PROT|nr:ABC transporter permease [Roseomonas acroporae]MCK8785894.1 ABC transporter permease [Roseomonas acroporae]